MVFQCVGRSKTPAVYTYVCMLKIISLGDTKIMGRYKQWTRGPRTGDQGTEDP